MSGLDGTLRGSCIVCFGGTDSGLVFAGTAGFAVAGLVKLGVPEEQAAAIVSHGTGCEDGLVPVGNIELGFRVCKVCADRAGVEIGVFGVSIPHYAQAAS